MQREVIVLKKQETVIIPIGMPDQAIHAASTKASPNVSASEDLNVSGNITNSSDALGGQIISPASLYMPQSQQEQFLMHQQH